MLHAVQTYLKYGLLLFVFVASRPLFAGTGQPRLLSDLDIPLMAGFQEDRDSRVIFDTPQGRIIEGRASGPHSAADVFDYYRLVLPTLSWQTIANKIKNCGGAGFLCLKAQRDGEILTIKIREIKPPGQKTVIYFSVNPE